MNERDLERKRTRDLFGPLTAAHEESHGISKYVLIADTIGELEGRIRSKGLKMTDMPSRTTRIMYVIHEEGQLFDDALGVWSIDGKVWVGENGLDRFTELVGFEDNK